MRCSSSRRPGSRRHRRPSRNQGLLLALGMLLCTPASGTAQDLAELEVIDQVIQEPLGGAHRKKAETVAAVGEALEKSLAELRAETGDDLKTQRRSKFLAMGKKGLS